ncbi:MAG: ImmA/IrrE family metallo-endopeptidase [Myxococcota bacterium]
MATRRRRSGFTKALAEEIALELRGELGLGVNDTLDAAALAAHLMVPVLRIDQIHILDDQTRRFFTRGAGRSLFSAATIHLDEMQRGIVVNPAHARTRQGNSVCHEIGHIVLEHEPEGPLTLTNGRVWNREQEDQADYIAGALLIPKEAAHAAAIAGQTDEEVAELFCVSVAVAKMRMNGTGARLRARRRARLWTGP